MQDDFVAYAKELVFQENVAACLPKEDKQKVMAKFEIYFCNQCLEKGARRIDVGGKLPTLCSSCVKKRKKEESIRSHKRNPQDVKDFYTSVIGKYR